MNHRRTKYKLGESPYLVVYILNGWREWIKKVNHEMEWWKTRERMNHDKSNEFENVKDRWQYHLRKSDRHNSGVKLTIVK